MKYLVFLLLLVLSGCKDDSTSTPVEGEDDNTVVVDYTVLNPSFEEEIDYELDYKWDTFQSDSMYSMNEEQASEGNSSLEITSLFGGFLSVWQVIPIEGMDYRADFNDQMSALQTMRNESDTTLPDIGDRVELSVDIFVEASTDIDNTLPFLVYIESENAQGEKTIIAESDVLDITPGEWFTLTTVPSANNGVIPEDSVLTVISYQINIPEDGIVYIDNTQFGKRVNEDDVPDDDIEEYEEGNTFDINHHSFEMDNPFDQTLTYSTDAYYGDKSINLPKQESLTYETTFDASVLNETLSAGIWMKRTNPNGSASIELWAYYQGRYHLVDDAFLEDTSVWNYIKTAPNETLKEETIEKIKFVINNDTSGSLLIDFMQIGDTQAFNGNPEKLALIAYQPWYASEADGWGNWQYTDASDFEGGKNSFPSRFIDGERDIAAVYYPLIGVYDSSDREVINYHLDLIKAMNIDVVQVNYYANLNQNMLDALEIIFELAEDKNLKVSILYEPKIHINGWIPHNTRMDAIEAIEQDLMDFIDRYKNSKALLKIDNAPVIEIFGVNILRNTEWNMILDNINTLGYTPYLMGDYIQNSDYSSMRGMFQWDLYNESLADATLEEVNTHVKDINTVTLEWANKRNGYNIPVGLVYPGFDDTAVLGWDLGVIRKIDISGPDFYRESWKAFHSLEGFNWVLIATFNDWNESTIIEPEVTMGHEMAIITQEQVAQFKGDGIVDEALLEQITQAYLESRTNNYD